MTTGGIDESELRRAAASAMLTLTRSRRLLPHQVPPPGDWRGWALIGGRGSGKTEACARYVVEHVRGPACLSGPSPHWMSIIAPTLGDAATSCYSGPSGIRTHDPDAKMISAAGGLTIRWPNGSEAKMFGASSPEDEERLRSGGNRCLAWVEELAAWRYQDACWNHMRFGLRVGPRPHWVGSTTPKPRPLIKRIMKGELANVVLTHATMWDNPHLPLDIRQELEDAFAGTRLGEQELYARLLEEDENALWTRDVIARNRLRADDCPPWTRVCVGVDPSGGAGEQGIVVDAKWNRLELLPITVNGTEMIRKVPVNDGYVLDDRTCHLSPEGWGRRAVQAAIDWEADDICVEINFGGDMAVATIVGAADAMGINIPVRKVTATRGKRVRAEPVSALAARERWHHVGTFPELEDQLCTWTPESDYSPDRLDAMVWPAWHMNIVSTHRSPRGSYGGSAFSAAQIVPVIP